MKPLLEIAAVGAVKLLASTWRLEVHGERNVVELRESRIPLVFTVWHALLLPPLWHRRGEGITLLVSDHGDAEYLAGAALRWGYEVTRGSSTRGAVKGTLGLARTLMQGREVALTPDGPTGPARVVKAGAVSVAARAGAAVVPIGVGTSSSWRLGSWDLFAIPKPFARVRLVYGTPMRFPTELAGAVDEATAALQRALNDATDSAEC